MRKRCNFGYFVSEGFHSIFTHGLMSFAAVCMIVCCLIIMGSFALLAVNADQMMGQMESENQFFVYIDETYTEEQIATLQKQVEAVPNVDFVEFVTKEEAKDTYLDGRDSDLFSNMPDEVFRDRLAIHVVDLEQLDATVDQVTQLSGVANYWVEGELADAFVTARNVAAALATILIVILAAVSLFIISNTVRLATFARREEIAIMKMCGATDGFIRWPFVVEGLLLGLAGAVIAFLLQWGIYAAVYQAVVSSNATMLITLVPFQSMWAKVLGVFALAGVIIGAGGSTLAIRRFLQV